MVITKLIKRFFLSLGFEIRRLDTSRNRYINCSNWEYQKQKILSQLTNEGIIMDIGSGHNPVPRANILADFFPETTLHRGGPLIEDRPLIICSVERIPVLSKSIEFVICSHVLEHVESPIRAGKELSRIAKAGYIETPAYGKDIIVGTGNMHRWQVVEFEGTMHFFEYSERQNQAHTTSPVMDLWCQQSYHPWQDFFWERQDLFNAMHLWEANPVILEYHRSNRQVSPLNPWRSIVESDLPDEPILLTDREIELLNSCLSTPDGIETMKYTEGKFVNKTGNIIYPVRGKRIYFEMAK
jgi:hypothetical protein